MELIGYLLDNFYTKEQLLSVTKLTEQELEHFQQQGVMPKCSYKLSLQTTCDSFFGLHQDANDIEFYAKGYASWLAIIQSLKSQEAIFSLFAERYQEQIKMLNTLGHYSLDAKVNDNLNLHIKDEWNHFIDGIYGLCTKSGLPEDIASKEFAIIEINELITLENLDEEQKVKLEAAVNLLDQVSTLFAPHERHKSSRFRLVDEVRRKYQLPVPQGAI